MILTAGQGDALLRRQEGANIAFKLGNGKLGLQNFPDDAVIDDGITVDQDIVERDDARMVMDAVELFSGLPCRVGSALRQ